MVEQLISFETAKLAKEKGFDINGQDVFDLKNNNKIINFKDLAVQEFIEDVETGYRDKALNYLKENINRTDDNSDEEYYLLAPTQSLLSKWLREKHNIIVLVDYEGIDGYYYKFYSYKEGNKNYDASDKNYNTYEEALEAGLQVGLQVALKLI